MSNRLSALLQITPQGRKVVEDANRIGPEQSMLSYLEMRGSASAAALIGYSGLQEKEGRKVLNSLLRKRLVRSAEDKEE